MHLILFLVGIVLAFAGAMLIHSSVPVADVAAAALFNSGDHRDRGRSDPDGARGRGAQRRADRGALRHAAAPAAAGRGGRARGPGTPPGASGATERREAPKRSVAALAGSAAAARRPRTAPRDAPRAAVPEPASTAGRSRAADPCSRGAARRGAAADSAAPAPKPRAHRRCAPPAKAAPAAGGQATPETTVYKSGVIDGMAYTLFMDGAIEAELPQGTVKFASIDELQKYLTQRGSKLAVTRSRPLAPPATSIANA